MAMKSEFAKEVCIWISRFSTPRSSLFIMPIPSTQTHNTHSHFTLTHKDAAERREIREKKDAERAKWKAEEPQKMNKDGPKPRPKK